MDQTLKNRIFGILEPGDEDSKYFDPFIMGIGLFALPAGVLAAGFSEVLQRKREAGRAESMICPHCKKRIDEAQMRAAGFLRDENGKGGSDTNEK